MEADVSLAEGINAKPEELQKLANARLGRIMAALWMRLTDCGEAESIGRESRTGGTEEADCEDAEVFA